jgi:uncharacterized protein YraI
MTTGTTFRSVTLLILVLALATAACGLPAGAATPTVAAILPTAPPASATVAPTDVPASPTAESSATAPAAAAPVRVSASGGNMTLRRGPATAYDVRGYMLAGQATSAVARNEAADWLLVQDPSTAGSTAWVNAASRYIAIEAEAGAVQALPVQTVDPAVPAYVRNCTFHPMRILPADYVLKEQTYPPDNRRAFSPGVVEAFDQSVEGNPKVMSEELSEGETIDITKDGLSNSYACPS